MRILFIIAACEEKNYGNGYHLGFLSLASAVRSKKFLSKLIYPKNNTSNSNLFLPSIKIQLIDMNFVSDEYDLPKKIHDFSPDIVGVSCDSTSVDSAYYIAKICADIRPEAFRIIGGIHATVFPKEVLKKSFFQAAFIGDAIESFARLVIKKSIDQHFDISTIRGLSFKDDSGEIFFTEPSKNICNIDEYPSVVDSYDLVNYLEKKYPAYIYSSLGCQYRCHYCARATIRKSLIVRDPLKVVNDMVRLYKLGYKKQFIHDDTFASNRKNTIIFLNELMKIKLKDLTWGAQTRVNKLMKNSMPDKELITRMKKAGCISIELGVETLDPQLGEQLKGIANQDVYKVTEALTEIGIKINYNLMVGLPGQTWNSIMKTLRELFYFKYPGQTQNTLSVLYCVPYPGSLIHVNNTVRIIKQRDGDNYPPYAIRELVELSRNIEQIPYGFEVPNLVPTETDVMTSQEIAEAYFYHMIYARFNQEKISNQIVWALVFWREIATRMIIDKVANSKDAPKDLTRNQIVIKLRKTMLKGPPDYMFPGSDYFQLFSMLGKISFCNGFELLSWLDHNEIYKFIAILYKISIFTEECFDKIKFVLSQDIKRQHLSQLMQKLGTPSEIMKCGIYEKKTTKSIKNIQNKFTKKFTNGKIKIILMGLEFGFDPNTNKLLLFLH
jgi:radical SAM superfamily enzyme YgiQ (UPF0313 family)